MVRRGGQNKKAAPKQSRASKLRTPTSDDEDLQQPSEDSQQSKRQRPEEDPDTGSDAESVASEADPSSENKSREKQTGEESARVNISPKIEEQLADWYRVNPSSTIRLIEISRTLPRKNGCWRIKAGNSAFQV